MCRFAAYIGSPVALEDIVVLPAHSLLEQSQNATEAKLAVNGDGFGIAWYTDRLEPGLYRDVLPAWSDGNLPSLCRMITSRLFLAHVRASTIGETARSNCHPFTHGRWAFMHNGQIGDFTQVRRQLEAALPDPLYMARRGGTDSELLFLTLLAQGLDQDPPGAIRRTLAELRRLQGPLIQPNRITVALSDGQQLFAFRHSSDARSPTLYWGPGPDGTGTLVASERLTRETAPWQAVPDDTLVSVSRAGVTTQPLQDIGWTACAG